MRYAILSDIHANLAAFEAVLKDIEGKGSLDKIWCLGDIVGYGPDPCKCIDLLRKFDSVCVAGNHDQAAVGMIQTADFNRDAADANRWTAQQLATCDYIYLEKLELTFEVDDFALVHGSPREPVWEYLLSEQSARDNFVALQKQFCLVGHSHIPLVFTEIDGAIKIDSFPDGAELPLGSNRMIVNPGSVGQPRDNDPRASYAIYDSGNGIISHHRVDYDIRSTQARMAEEGLPAFLIERLSHGW